MNKIRPFILSEANWKNIKDRKWEVAVLPWGATEAHNYHLPYATDNIQCAHIAERAAEIAWGKGARVMVLPGIPFGVNKAQIDVKFNINMNPSTQFLVLKDIVDSLKTQGCRKLVILNGHGGNHFSHMLRELYDKNRFFICVADWYKAVDRKERSARSGDHGGELETSVMLHIAPQLVLPLDQAGPGKARKFKMKSFGEGWVWAQRGWLGDLTEDAGIGDPALASSKKGKRIADAVIDKIAGLLIEIDRAKLDDLYL